MRHRYGLFLDVVPICHGLTLSKGEFPLCYEACNVGGLIPLNTVWETLRF